MTPKSHHIGDVIPSEREVVADTAQLLRALAILMRVLLTSTAFRALLTDLIGLAKDVVGDTAVKVEHAAETVQNIAQVVQDTARTVETASRPTAPEETLVPSLTTPATGISASNDGQSPTSGSWDIVSNEDLERMKTTLVRRLQEASIYSALDDYP